MLLEITTYDGKQTIYEVESFEFRTNQVSNWIRLILPNNEKLTIHKICTIKHIT